MIKIVMLVRRKDGISREAFREHYENIHAPLAMSVLPTLRAYTRNYPEMHLVGQEPGFDAVTELWFDDEASWQESIAVAQSEKGKALAEDEETFIDRAATVAMVARECRSDIS
jgi:uncharacterized protein (TIGR02118 family)